MELFYYLLKVSTCLVLFFAFYLLVLRKLTFFKINRFYLLATLLLSFVIPTLHFTVEREVEQASVATDEVITSSNEFQEVGVHKNFTPVLNQIESAEKTDWLALIEYAYVLVTAIILLIGIERVVVLLQYTKQKAKSVDGLKLLNKTSGFTNCSFFNYVFIDEKSLTANELAVLLQHEKVHSQQYHSVDKMLMMIAKSVLWFNPVIYLWDKSLEQTHEYEADYITSQAFGNQNYAALLLRFSVGENRSSLVHNFVKSPIKERIKMLFNSKSRNMKKLTYLLVAPIILGLIWGFTVNVVEVNTRNKTKSGFKDEKWSNLKSELSNGEDKLFDKRLRAKVKGVEKTEVGEIIRFEYEKKIIPVFNISNISSFNIGEEMLITLSGKLNGLKVMDAKGKILKDLYTPCYTLSKLETVKGDVLYKAEYSFIEMENFTFAGGGLGRMIYVKSPNGKKMHAVLITEEFGVKFLVNGKLYSLDEAKKFDHTFLNALSTKQGVGRGNYYQVKGVGINDHVFWFGKEPSIQPSVAKSKLAAAKYTGKSIYGRVLSYTYSNKKIDGFVIQQKSDEKLKIYIGSQFGKQVSEEIKVGDDIKVNAFNALLADGATFPAIGSSTIVKNGKVIFDRGKFVVDARPEGVKTDYRTLAKIEYHASDSVIRTHDRKIIDLYGKARLSLDSLTLNADHININNNTKSVTAYDAEITSPYNNLKVKASEIRYDLTTKKFTAKKPSSEY